MIRAEIVKRDVFRLFDSVAEIISEVLIEEMREELKRKDAIATGYLYNSFTYKKQRGGEWAIINEAPYSAILEFGCGPHTPPYDAILNWVKIKKKEPEGEAEKAAWRIIKKIEREGYAPRYYARDVLRRIHRKVITL
ncbi:MAG: hypothetical protein QXF58_04255 [Desulfurococcaceae archaeon]